MRFRAIWGVASLATGKRSEQEISLEYHLLAYRVIIGILIFRPSKGGGLLIMGLHWGTS